VCFPLRSLLLDEARTMSRAVWNFDGTIPSVSWTIRLALGVLLSLLF
jgi:hypothetical protein